MAAMGAILSKVEGMFQKSGAAIGSTFGKEAEAKIAALAEAERKSANVTQDAETRKTVSIHATEVAQQNAALATERRILAETRYRDIAVGTLATDNQVTAAKLRLEAATIAETRASYAAGDAALAQTARTRDLAVAQGLSAKAADAHAGAIAASAVTASNAGRAFNIAGVAMAGGFLFAAGEATKMAGNFQQSMIKLTASAGESKGNLQVVGDGILHLAGQVGISANTLADSMFLVEKAGFRGGDGLKVLTAAAQLANAEGADLNDTINGLTTTMNDFGFKVDQAATVASKMNVAAGDSKAPLQQFSAALHNVEPTAAMAKVGIDEVYAAMARITQSGAGADQASEWLNNTIGHLMNMNDQQKTFLQQIKMDPVGLQQDLRNPAIGMSGVITEISDKIKSQLNPQQQLVLDKQFQSVQAVQSLNAEYDQLVKRGPQFKDLADKLKAGTIDKHDLQALRVGGKNDPDLTNFATTLAKLEGVNAQIKKGQGDLIGVAAAFAKAFGTDSGLKVVSLLAGTPEQAKAMTDEIKKLQTTTQEADGTVKGFNETQEGLNKKLADAKAGFGAAAIQVGNLFIPAMTTAANVLKDVAQYLVQHKGYLDAALLSIGAFGGAWLFFKTIAIGSSMWSTISTGLGMMITKLGLVKVAAAETATEVAAIGPAAVTSEAEVATAAATGTTALEAEGAAAVATTGEIAALGAAVAGAAAAAAAVVAGTTAAGNWIANKIQGTTTGWMDVVKEGIDAPGRIWSGITHGGDIYANDGIQVDVEHNKNFQTIFGNQDLGPLQDHRGKKSGSAGGTPVGLVDPMAALNGLGTPGADTPTGLDPSVAGFDGGSGSGSKGAPAAPVGSRNDPIFIDPSSITDGLNSSDMGASGSVGGGIADIFTNAGSGGFTLPNIAKLMGTFVANLALGNPAGKLATGAFDGAGGEGDLTSSITDIQNMTPAQRIEEQNTIKMQKGIRAYKKALREYAKAIRKFGPGSDEALNAEDSVLSARDAIDSSEISMQQKGGSAAQAYADDIAKGVDVTNPGKFAKDQAAASAYGSGSASGAVPAGPGAEGWRNTVAATVDKYAAQMGIPDSKKGEWVNAIVSQIGTESSGNAGADNDHDPNGQGGIQHVAGLLQYLPSSYANSGGKLTGLPYMDPVGQIAGALFAPRNAAGDPTGIGHGIGWGPVARDVAPAGASDLSDVPRYFGEGMGIKQSPAAPDTSMPQDASQYNYQDLVGAQWVAGKGWVRPDGSVAQPKASNPFGPGGALSAIPSAGAPGGRIPVGPPASPGSPAPGSIGGIPTPAGVGPRPVPGRDLAVNAVNGVKPGSVGQPASPGVQSSQPVGGSGKGGVGISQGIMSAASTALGTMFPGSQVALQEANRGAQYLGQVAGIAASGLLETFTLHGANGAGGNGGWLGKIAGGLAGAHKSSPNSAGAAPGLDPASKESAAPLKPGDPPPGGPKPGDPNSPGPGNGNNTINIENQNINHDDGGANNRDAMRQLQAFNT